MIFNRFTILLIVRLTLILGLMLMIAFTQLASKWLFVNLVLFILLMTAIADVYRFLSRTNIDLVKLLSALKNEDFAFHFPKSSSSQLFENLHDTFNEVVELQRQNQLEKEAHKEFLKIAVDRLKIGVIAVDDRQQILIFNEYARSLLSTRTPTDWSILLMRKIPLVLKMEEMKAEETEVFNFKSKEISLSLSIRIHTFVILDQPTRLFTFQDIRDELDRQELASWHKVIRILTHEIMNSLTPVISLTETAGMLLENKSDESLLDIKTAVDVASTRAKGLLSFVRSYRQFLKVPEPKMKPINVAVFLQNIQEYFSAIFEQKNIDFRLQSINVPKSFLGDQYLLEQVFINLIKNAIDAVDNIENPTIEIKVVQNEHMLVFEVRDNGKGISTEEMEKVFIPFFTTKEKGTGVGLSLSRQIVVGHGGRMTFHSPVEGGVVFKVELLIGYITS